MAVDLETFICERPCIANKTKIQYSRIWCEPRVYLPRGLILKSFAKIRQIFRQETTFAHTEKNAGSHVGTLAIFVMDNLYMDLQIDNNSTIINKWQALSLFTIAARVSQQLEARHSNAQQGSAAGVHIDSTSALLQEPGQVVSSSPGRFFSNWELTMLFTATYSATYSSCIE